MKKSEQALESVESFREVEVKALRSNEPVLLGLESLIDGILECRDGLASLKGNPKDQAYFSNLYKISNSLSGLNRTLLDLSKYVSDYNQLRQHAAGELIREVQIAFGRVPELAEQVTTFIDEVARED